MDSLLRLQPFVTFLGTPVSTGATPSMPLWAIFLVDQIVTRVGVPLGAVCSKPGIIAGSLAGIHTGPTLSMRSLSTAALNKVVARVGVSFWAMCLERVSMGKRVVKMDVLLSGYRSKMGNVDASLVQALVVQLHPIWNRSDKPVPEQAVNQPWPTLPTDTSVAMLHGLALPFKAPILQKNDTSVDAALCVGSHISPFAITEGNSYA